MSGQERLGEDGQASGHFQQSGGRVFGEVAGAVGDGMVKAPGAVGGKPPRGAPGAVDSVEGGAGRKDPGREPTQVRRGIGQWLSRAAVRSAAARSRLAAAGSPSRETGGWPSSSSWAVASQVATV